MVLVDTSVWIDHFRRVDSELVSLLEEQQVVTHDFVIGELACGFLRDRSAVISALEALPRLPPVRHAELLHFIEARELAGTGLGLVDVHLLAASALRADVELWSRDKSLDRAARKIRVH